MYPAIINRHPGPGISIEHRLLYNLDFTVSPADKRVPPPATWRARPRRHDRRHVGHGAELRAAQYVQDTAGISVEVDLTRSAIRIGTLSPRACARRTPGGRRHVLAGAASPPRSAGNW
jgi:hypothetical protein